MNEAKTLPGLPESPGNPGDPKPGNPKTQIITFIKAEDIY